MLKGSAQKTTKLHQFKIKIFHIFLQPWVYFLADLGFTSISFILSLLALVPADPLNGTALIAANKDPLIAIVIIFFLVCFLLKTGFFIWTRPTYKQFQRVQHSEALSLAILKSIQASNGNKARSVLEIVYGRVPEWHPFNYRDNILTYNIHEHLRAILIDLRSALITIFNIPSSDLITVDLVYCYPDDENPLGKLPMTEQQESETEEDLSWKKKWKFITSTDCSPLDVELHGFLKNPYSFYHYLEENNYAFCSDKSKLSHNTQDQNKSPHNTQDQNKSPHNTQDQNESPHDIQNNSERDNKPIKYIPSAKDREYDNKGSIAGMTLDVKTDEPERILVKAMLTITTYGQNLMPDNITISEKEYKELFKVNVLNVYKSLLESELSQMYIRHMIKDKHMCPYTGITKVSKSCLFNMPSDSKTCAFTSRNCRFLP